jgi:signal peptidase I
VSAANGGRFAAAALASLSLAVCGTFVAGRVAGYKYLTVLSGSMAPQMQVGDLVIDENVKATDVRAGQVITFLDPEGGQRLITHRVRSVARAGDNIAVVTKGDHNNATESWQMPADGTVGRVVARIPYAGRAIGAMSGRVGRMLLMFAILAWAAYEGRDWLRPRGVRVADPEPDLVSA